MHIIDAILRFVEKVYVNICTQMAISYTLLWVTLKGYDCIICYCGWFFFAISYIYFRVVLTSHVLHPSMSPLVCLKKFWLSCKSSQPLHFLNFFVHKAWMFICTWTSLNEIQFYPHQFVIIWMKMLRVFLFPYVSRMLANNMIDVCLFLLEMWHKIKDTNVCIMFDLKFWSDYSFFTCTHYWKLMKFINGESW
jgi:hypothetical protein